MERVDKAVLNMLKVNMGYKKGESIAIIMQLWNPNFPEHFRTAFEKSEKLCNKIQDVFNKAGISVDLFKYIPSEPRHGVDVSPELYDEFVYADIIFEPTVFSLTHTNFSKVQVEKGARIASTPTFTLDMFAKKGPMDVDYKRLEKITKDTANKLSKSRFVKVTGKKTNITVEIDKKLVEASSGLITKKGQVNNLPGAEAYAVPVHKGDSNGYFTVPKGWGGAKALKHELTFVVQNGMIIDIKGPKDYIEKEIKPIVFGGKDFNVLAELGIGTNPNITNEYIKKHGWSVLTGEKIYGSAHFANGNSKGMGGKNDVPVHQDWVVPNVKIEFMK